MKRFLLTLALTAMALFVFDSAASAALVVGQGDIETSTGGATSVSFKNIINGNSSLGHTFNNNIFSNVAGSGGAVRSVSTNLLSTYGTAGGGGSLALYNGNPVLLVIAVEGATTAGAAPVFTATSGRLGFFESSFGYNQYDPTTWGVTNAAGTTLLSPIAVWDLKPAEAIFDPGPDTSPGAGPGIFNLAEEQVNQISINTAGPVASQGFFLARESTTYTDPTLSGNSFWTTTGLPIGFDIDDGEDEGLILRVDEQVNFNPSTNTGFISGGVGTAGFDALNTIASALGGLPFFATGFGAGLATSFDPDPGPGVSADILTTIGGTSGAGVQFGVPEPSSFLIWAVVGAACVGANGWRRRRTARRS